MFSIWEYLWGAPEPEKPKICSEDLLKVKLKPPKEKKPALARNMPKHFDLLRLDQSQLDEILSVKLKHVVVPERPKIWLSANPLLRELQEKIPLYL
jgi:hypothetical protein